MNCAHPLSLRYKDYGTIQVPCNKCITCRSHKASLWSDRIRFEVRDKFQDSCFVTLTYDDEHLPYSFHDDGVVRSTLVPKHLTDFFKRLRKQISKYTDRKIKYFACGEYGGRFGRPHYHVFLIGVLRTKQSVDLIDNCWKMGNIDVQSPRDTEDCVRYVTGYILKKFTGRKGQDKYGSAFPPFQRFSQHLGNNYYLQHKDEILAREGILVRGQVHTLPRSILLKPEFEQLARKFKSKFFLDQLVNADPDKDDRDLRKALKRESELYTLSLRS